MEDDTGSRIIFRSVYGCQRNDLITVSAADAHVRPSRPRFRPFCALSNRGELRYRLSHPMSGHAARKVRYLSHSPARNDAIIAGTV